MWLTALLQELKAACDFTAVARKRRAARKIRAALRLTVEALENRCLLSGEGLNTFARFVGDIAAPGERDAISIQVEKRDFMLPHKKILLGFALHAAQDSALDPGLITVRPARGSHAHTVIRKVDTSGDSASLTLAQVTRGSFQVQVRAEGKTTGGYVLDTFLAGDTQGDYKVDLHDIDFIRGLLGTRRGDPRYVLDADVDRNGRISRRDLRLAKQNLGTVTLVRPLSITLELDPSSDPDRDGITNQSPVILLGQTLPGAKVQLDEWADGSLEQMTAADAEGRYRFNVPVEPGITLIRTSASGAFGQHATADLSLAFVGADAQPPVVVIESPTSSLITNTNVTVTGLVTDNASGVAFLQAGLDGGSFFEVAFDGSGNFSFATALPLDGSAEGGHTVRLQAADTAGNRSSVDVSFTLDTRAPVVVIQSPGASATITGNVAVTGTVTDATSGVASLRAQIDMGAFFDVTFAASSFRFTTSFALDGSADGGHTVHLRATDLAGNVSPAADLPFTLDPHNAAAAAPPVDPTVATTLAAATQFLYTGSNPIQSGVAADTINPVRAAVLRGQVQAGDGSPLPRVNVTVLNHSEFGSTLTDADGTFNMAVNGGGLLTVSYSKEGFLPVQRQVEAPWQDYALLPEVVMIPADSRVTAIDLSATTPVQVAQANVVTDADGTRQATLLFAQGTHAAMTLPDGTTQDLTTLHVRATEYTVGPNGPAAMPAELPPTSGYTYAVELSVDEAQAAGAKEVRFDQPVSFYVENFLGFPVGGIVPAGFYDRTAGQWVPSRNGRVVQVLSEASGLALLDIDGDATADDAAALIALGISDAERQQLAALYEPGQSLWRVPITHFSSWDCNWPYGLPDDARAPDPPPKLPKLPDLDDSCLQDGSIIECQNQVLGEAVNVTGTPFTVNYRSGRVPGRTVAYALDIPVSGPVLPASLKRIELTIAVAGRAFTHTFAAAPNQTHHFLWDGKDVYGRMLQGEQPVTISIGYGYDAVYEGPASVGQSFARISNNPGVSFIGNRARQEIIIYRTLHDTIGAFDARGQGLGAWTLDVQHAYDPLVRVLYLGDGERRSAAALGSRVISTVAGPGQFQNLGDGGPATRAELFFPLGVAAGPDGSLYIADGGHHRIRRVGPDGIITTIAGTGLSGFSGDGGPATQAEISGPTQLALGPDGSLFFADLDNRRIRRVGPDGTITTVAGGGSRLFVDGILVAPADGMPATQAFLGDPQGVALAPDGSLYIAVNAFGRIIRVGLDGIITTVAGGNGFGFSGTGGPAIQAQLRSPQQLAVGPDGSLFFTDSGNYSVHRVSPSGIITTIAGTGTAGFSGDAGPATLARLASPEGIAVDRDGSLYIADTQNNRVRLVSPDGIINTVVGHDTFGFSGDGGLGALAQLDFPFGLALAPDGSLYIADTSNARIRRTGPPLPGFTAREFIVPSEDASEVYLFDAVGRHLQTTNALTGSVIVRFTYDAAGRLLAVTDADANVTRIERNAGGEPTALLAPGGQRTALGLDANGYLNRITNPAGEAVGLTYTSDGLLTRLTDPKAGVYRFTYDALGRLIRDEDPAGGFSALARTETADGFAVTLTTAQNQAFSYLIENLATGDQRRVNTAPNGLTSETLIRTDGSRRLTAPDGTVVNMVTGPDPRFGMQMPVLQSQTITSPGGLRASFTGGRTASLSDPNDPLSLLTLTDTFGINGRTYASTFTAAQNQIIDRTPEGRQVVTTLDNQGRALKVQVADLAPLGFTYDAQGRLATATEGSGAEARVYVASYDPQNHLVGLTDPLSRTVSFAYDAAGRLVSETLPGGRQIGFIYDVNGNVTSIIPPGQPAHAFGYSPVNLGVAYTPPDLGAGSTETVVAYDADKRPTLVTRPDGTTVRLTYDNAGQPSTLVLPRGPVQYAYSPTTGNLTTVTAPDGGTLSYTYDGTLLTGSIWTGSVSGSVGRTYDNNFRITAENVDGGQTVTFGYDRDDLLVRAGALDVSRNPQTGLITGTALGGVTDSRDLNEFSEWRGYRASFNNAELLAVQYTADKLGRFTQKTEAINGQSDTYAYEYDVAGRLIEVRQNGNVVAHYTYDGNGNRLSYTGPAGTTTGTYDVQDRLLQYGTTTYAYTAHGELQSKTEGGQSTAYDYDPLGNLLAVTLPDGTRVDYVIDGNNRRIGEKVNGVLVRGFLYRDQLEPVAELDGQNQVISRFVYATKAHVPDYLEKDGRTYRILSDHLGSVRLVVDAASGAVAQRMDYDEFGNVTLDTNPGFQPFGFAGGLYDRRTLLNRFGFRDYDARTGRWTAKDPIGFLGGDTNLYAYVANDPGNLADPDGLLQKDLARALEYWGNTISNASLPEWMLLHGKAQVAADTIGDFAAGFGDLLTGGFTKWVRDQWDAPFDLCDPVDYDSGAYFAGEVGGFAVGAVLTGGAANAPAGAAAAGAELDYAAIAARAGRLRSARDATYGLGGFF